jgi:predicted metalloprotease with PDZ domain
MKYTISYQKPHRHLIDISLQVEEHSGDILIVQLPAWRPGRYELGNFAKNIQKFSVAGTDGKPLSYRKVSKDSWEIDTPGQSEVTVSYSYYGAVLDAGSTFMDESMLYMNPVNCCMFVPSRINETCEIRFENLPQDYTIACGMKKTSGHVMEAENFHELADSPLIASNTLVHRTFDVEDTEIHIWIQGSVSIQMEKFIEDIRKYSIAQSLSFGGIPCEEYHYLFHFAPYKAHHGVEHHNSTVILMGPGSEFSHPEPYNELLAISSHEFYHLWNVKRIRPADMWPYDYTRENYSSLGYIYEGVTTYYGDYYLLRSGVITDEDYFDEFSRDVQKHFDNFGRYHYSVAQSSFDTWLDGYVPGIPNRKVSIYTEGMLAAFILDVWLMRDSNQQYSLDDVMLRLYRDFALKGKGYTEADYKNIIESLAGTSYSGYFEDFIHGRGKVETELPAALDFIGCELIKEDARYVFEHEYGFKLQGNSKYVVTSVVPDSPADRAGLAKDDELISANLVEFHGSNSAAEIFEDFGGGVVNLVVSSSNRLREVILTPCSVKYYPLYRVKRKATPTDEQLHNFNLWRSR